MDLLRLGLVVMEGPEGVENLEGAIYMEAWSAWRRYPWPPDWDVEDVVQEARVEAMLIAKAWNPDRGVSFLAYFFSIFRWRLHNRWRQVNRHRQHELDYDHHTLVEIAPATKDDPEALVLLAELWGSLTSHQRLVVAAMVGVPKAAQTEEARRERAEVRASLGGVTRQAINNSLADAATRARRWRDG